MAALPEPGDSTLAAAPAQRLPAAALPSAAVTAEQLPPVMRAEGLTEPSGSPRAGAAAATRATAAAPSAIALPLTPGGIARFVALGWAAALAAAFVAIVLTPATAQRAALAPILVWLRDGAFLVPASALAMLAAATLVGATRPGGPAGDDTSVAPAATRSGAEGDGTSADADAAPGSGLGLLWAIAAAIVLGGLAMPLFQAHRFLFGGPAGDGAWLGDMLWAGAVAFGAGAVVFGVAALTVRAGWPFEQTPDLGTPHPTPRPSGPALVPQVPEMTRGDR